MENIWWNVGGGIKHFKELDKFNEDCKIFYDTKHNFFNAVYDSIFGMKWNGGRVCNPKDFVSLAEWIKIIERYNEQNIGFNFSFSNVLLTEEDLSDEYCNLMLQVGNNKKINGVILTSDLLAEYIRNNYPNLKIIYSVCNGLNNLEDYNKATNNNLYDIVVLHPDFNHDFNFLSNLENKNKIEIMVNDNCAYGCPYRAEHYKWLSQCAKQQATNPIIHYENELDRDIKPCYAVLNGYIKDGRNRVSFYDLDNYINMGFQRFKLIGREFSWEEFKERDLIPNLEQYWIRKIIKEQKEHKHI